MSLPSQIGRIGPAGSGGRARTYMVSKRRRAARRPLLALGFMGAIGAVIAYVWMQKPPAGGEVAAATINADSGAEEQDDDRRYPFDFGAPVKKEEAKLPPAHVELTMAGTVQTKEDSSKPVEPIQTEATKPALDEQNEAPKATISVIDAARREIDKNNLVGARALLQTALRSRTTQGAIRDQARAMISTINDDLIFSPRLHADETLTERYEVKGGDSLSMIASRQGLATDWRLIQRVNRISDPTKIREGQPLKLIRGPFHAVVHKADYRMDLYTGSPDEPRDWTFVRSFTVGLGEGDSTPAGEFVIRKDSKLVNPHWVNPRTGERFDKSDPKNPIGERWLGLEGLGEYDTLSGYGIHGTIDPDSIGKQRSMGCVRLGADDVELVYELLSEGVSRVTIVD